MSFSVRITLGSYGERAAVGRLALRVVNTNKKAPR
jgi:hypothetical protein